MTIETKIKSHPKVIYLDTNNFYWEINVAHSSNLKSDNLAKRLHSNNQQMWIDCLKTRSNKNERECEKCGCDYIYVPNY